MLLAGFLLCSLLQLALAQQQQTLSVVGRPAIPKEFQNLTLSLQRAPLEFTWCQWARETRSGKTGPILSLSPDQSPHARQEGAYTGRETVDRNCSLHIQRVSTQDAGTYTVSLRTGSTQQHGDRDQQQENLLQGTISLQVNGANKITLQVQIVPRHPRPGQGVILVPQGVPEQFYFCEWSKQTGVSASQVIKTYRQEERQQSDQQGREVIHRNCSLQIAQLRSADEGTYALYIEAPLSQQQKQPGREVTYEEKQFYTGLARLEVTDQSQTDSHQGTSRSSSLSYSPGILAAILLGSFAEPLMTGVSTFWSSLASLRPRLLP